MAAGAACVPIDVVYHREVLADSGAFFRKEAGRLAGLLEELERDEALARRLGSEARDRAMRFYRWDAVSAAYAELFTRVVAARRAGERLPRAGHHDVYHPDRFAHQGC